MLGFIFFGLKKCKILKYFYKKLFTLLLHSANIDSTKIVSLIKENRENSDAFLVPRKKKMFSERRGLMKKERFVLTVSRQYGSGGRELAGILAKKLDVKLYDRQLIHIAAAKLFTGELPDDDLYELASTIPPMDMSFLPFHSFGVKLGSGQYSREIFLAESNVIKRLAEKKSCVILGRCADYVLRENKNKFSIFVTADDDFRDKRGLTVYDGKTLKELDDENKKRARYYEYYTDQTWGDPANYDLVINTSRDPLEKIADGIIAYIEKIKN